MAKKVNPIPQGQQSVTASLTVKNAARAIDFYKKAFGATERMRMPDPGGAIMHAEMQMGTSIIFINDEVMNTKSPEAYGGSPVSFYVYVEDVDAAWKRAMDAGATGKMPPTDMFWGDRTSHLIDPFGHTWSLSQRVKDMKPQEIKKGQESFFAKMKK